jgi:hypothetical protein
VYTTEQRPSQAVVLHPRRLQNVLKFRSFLVNVDLLAKNETIRVLPSPDSACPSLHSTYLHSQCRNYANSEHQNFKLRTMIVKAFIMPAGNFFFCVQLTMTGCHARKDMRNFLLYRDNSEGFSCAQNDMRIVIVASTITSSSVVTSYLLADPARSF